MDQQPPAPPQPGPGVVPEKGSIWSEPAWLGAVALAAVALTLSPALLGRPWRWPWSYASLAGLLLIAFGAIRLLRLRSALGVAAVSPHRAVAEFWDTVGPSLRDRPVFLWLGLPQADAIQMMTAAQFAAAPVTANKAPGTTPFLARVGSFTLPSGAPLPCAVLVWHSPTPPPGVPDLGWLEFCQGLLRWRWPEVPLHGVTAFVDGPSPRTSMVLSDHLGQLRVLRDVARVQCPCVLALRDLNLPGDPANWPDVGLLDVATPDDAEARARLDGALDTFFRQRLPTEAVLALRSGGAPADPGVFPNMPPHVAEDNVLRLRRAAAWRRFWLDHREPVLDLLLALRDDGATGSKSAPVFFCGCVLWRAVSPSLWLVDYLATLRHAATWTASARRDGVRRAATTAAVLVALTIVLAVLLLYTRRLLPPPKAEPLSTPVVPSGARP